MYEDITFEDILERMLDRIPDDYDKREGSVIYDALAPAAVELQNMYMELDYIMEQSFADTATREYLIRRAAERGITPQEATKATLKAESLPTTLNIPIGSRYSLDDLNYVVTAKVTDGVYQMQCETAGIEGNQHLGDLIPIDYVDGLESIALTEVLIPGEDDEDTEVFRARYFASFESKAYGGNVDDYLEKTNSLEGVGATKVTPVWNGGGTVKLTIINSDYGKASATLVAAVQNAIDPTQDATGQGIAPIGHIVTVEAADTVTCNISTSITFQDGYSWASLETAITEAVEAYFLTLRQSWASESNTVVRTSQINSKITNIEGVLDVTDTKINDSESNLELDWNKIPVLGVITNE